ncbi:MAG: extracellular solute-binding protein, partial [Gammaproteobacteria bacterium]|nr:extracellular solute-binding protein [Gammaproteobacteria bacterium]
MRLFICTLLLLVLTGCSGEKQALEGITTIEVWAHAGQESERNVLQGQVTRFNAVHPDLQVQLTLIPEGSYNAQVQAAAVAGELPDLLEFDGPFLYAYVWQGRLRPLDDLLSDTLRADLLPSIVEQGRYHGRLW